MSESLRELMERWDGEALLSRYHRPTQAWIFIALHDLSMGPAAGGTRLKVYDRPEEGLLDAMRLSEGMTHKWASIELDSGGGKGVLALSRELTLDERHALLETYAQLIRRLKGSFSTGQDLGTTPEDILFLARHTRFVHGATADSSEANDPGPYTARGVLAGLRAALAHRFDGDDLAGHSILIQGAGGVGAPLARLCAEAGAELAIADLDAPRARRLADELSAGVVDADAVYDTECDVYAPCAVGATLNAASIPRLRCRVVAGSANNQLKEEADAGRLHERGILYAPDYVINAGGALAFGLIRRGETDEQVLRDRLDGLGATLTAIFHEAASRNESPLLAARRRVRRVLARARSGHQPPAASRSHSP